jgi:hypothetical protein
MKIVNKQYDLDYKRIVEGENELALNAEKLPDGAEVISMTVTITYIMPEENK